MNNDGRDEIIQEDNGEIQPRLLVISWNNCRDKRISLLPRNYVFPSMTLPNLLTMWYYGDSSKNIPPYRMIRGSYMRDMKVGIHKLSMIKKFVKNVEKRVRILNLPRLLVQNWTSRHVLGLYNADLKKLHFLLLTKGGASIKLLGRLITIFCVL